MFPASCDYHRAETLEDAVALLSALADREPAVIAGGQGLVQDMKLGAASPSVLVDIAEIDRLRGIDATEEGFEIGALTTHAALASAAALADDARVIADAAASVADRQVRNRGTIGGNLAEADPAADLPAAVIAADATIHVTGTDGERSIPAEAFFAGDGDTEMASDDVLVGVTVPASDGGAYVRKTHPASGYATIGVAARVDVADGTVTDAGVGVTGVTDRPTPLPTVAGALTEQPAGAVDIEAASAHAPEDIDDAQLRDDPSVSGAYRADLLPTYTARALRQAIDRVGGGGT